jgi:hypothetical protein
MVGLPMPGGGWLPFKNEERGGCLPVRLVAVPFVGAAAAWVLWAAGIAATHVFTWLLAPRVDIVTVAVSSPAFAFIVNHLAEHQLTERGKMLLEGEIKHVIEP